MAVKQERISLDLKERSIPAPDVFCQQGDKGWTLTVDVYDGGQPASLSGMEAKLVGMVPLYAEQSMTVSGSSVSCTVPGTFAAEKGTWNPYVQILQGSTLVASTQPFILKVGQGADLTGGEQQEHASWAQQMADAAEAAANSAEQSAAQAAASAESASDAVAACEDATAAANAAAENANNAAEKARGNILTGTVKDASVAHVDDAYAGGIVREVRVKGKTRQNLIPAMRNNAVNDVTIMSNSNGSISISGTASKESWIDITVAMYTLKPKTQYTLSINNSLSGIHSMYVYEFDANGNHVGNESSKAITGSYKQVTFTTESNTSSAVIGIRVTGNSTASGTYRVMLNEGSTAEDWCPPGLSSVGELRDDEKNLMLAINGSSNGINVTTNADGTVTISGTATATATIEVEVPGLVAGGTYTISIDKQVGGATSNHSFYLDSDVDGASYVGVDNVYSKSKTFGESATRFTVGILIVSGSTVSGTYKLMLNEGSKAAAWVKPESESAVNVSFTGKNILKDKPGWQNYSYGWPGTVYRNSVLTPRKLPYTSQGSWAGGFAQLFEFKAGQAITFSCGNAPNHTVMKYALQYSYNDLIPARTYTPVGTDFPMGNKNVPVNTPFTVTPDFDGWGVFMVSTPEIDVTSDNVVYPADFWMQVEVGNTATAYEPPATIATAPIDLDGNSLCSLPDGTCDELVWGADGSCNIDKSTLSAVLDGSSDENWKAYNTQSVTGVFYCTAFPGNSYNLVSGALINDRFHVESRNWEVQDQTASKQNSIAVSIIDEYKERVLIYAPQFSTVSDLTEWLSNNPITVVAGFSGETNETITPATMPALPESTSNAWAVSDPATELDMTYERDLTIAYDNLAAQVAALNVMQATD